MCVHHLFLLGRLRVDEHIRLVELSDPSAKCALSNALLHGGGAHGGGVETLGGVLHGVLSGTLR